MIKKIIVKNPTTGAQSEVEVGQLHPRVAECIYLQNKDGEDMSGNLEIKAPLGKKANIISQNESIQIKPGVDDPLEHTLQSLQLDAEMADAEMADDAGLCTEFPIKICNGKKVKARRVIGTKLNTSELVIDTQKAAVEFDPSEFDVKFRCDKWNSGTAEDGIGPIYAKFKARAMDFRCYDHGGIALQVAGADSDGHENKIKFESDRTNDCTELIPTYAGEGGKGIEFGTFNTQHTSLYTKDYRFKGDAKVYGVTRELATEPEESGKIDYITQNDDFKDVINPENCATWNEIISVANAYKNGTIGDGSGSSEGGSATVNPDVWASKSWVGEQGYFRLSDVNSLISPISTKVQGLESRIFRKAKNGNLEVSAEGLGKYAVENDPSTEIIPTEAVLFADVNEYNEAKGTELTEEEFLALTEEERVKTPAVEANPASLDLVSDGKIAIKGKELEIGAPVMSWAAEISKKNKVTLGGNDYYPVEEGNDVANTAATYEQIKALFPSLGINIEKNNSPEETIKAFGTGFIGVNLLDLISLVDRVKTLEEKVEELLSANKESNE